MTKASKQANGKNFKPRVKPTALVAKKRKQGSARLADHRRFTGLAEKLFKLIPSDIGRAVVNTVREPLLVLDNKLHVISANPSFYRMFKVSSEQTMRKRVYELGNHQWDIAPLRKLLGQVLLKQNSLEDFAVEHHSPRLGARKVLLKGRFLDHETDQMILLAITEAKDRVCQKAR